MLLILSTATDCQPTQAVGHFSGAGEGVQGVTQIGESLQRL